ncbi:MAG TPA: T9SS type A sorting domain-containing protein, partial [Chitinophagales bacterium]|nr:T9SS type A sorting domain-containing protein [Chitinophagales bacterium]
QITSIFIKGILFSIYFCININAFGQTLNSEFMEFIREKQQSTNVEMQIPANQNGLETESIIQDLIVPEWNFKELPIQSETAHIPIPIEIKRPASSNIIFEPQIVKELLKLRLIQNNTVIPVTVNIYDMEGTVFYTANIQNDVEIDISLYPPGTYILYTSSSATTHQFQKVVIQ